MPDPSTAGLDAPAPPPAETERLAEFLLEHARCGDDYWAQCSPARKDWYLGLAEDVLDHLATPSPEGGK